MKCTEAFDRIAEYMYKEDLEYSMFSYPGINKHKELWVSIKATGSQIGQSNFRGNTYGDILSQLLVAHPTKQSLANVSPHCNFQGNKK